MIAYCELNFVPVAFLVLVRLYDFVPECYTSICFIPSRSNFRALLDFFLQGAPQRSKYPTQPGVLLLQLLTVCKVCVRRYPLLNALSQHLVYIFFGYLRHFVLFTLERVVIHLLDGLNWVKPALQVNIRGLFDAVVLIGDNSERE